MIGNQELVRKTNQRLILEIIRREGLISRADLSKTLLLSAPTISANIERLLKRNVLQEVGSGDSRGGRPPILLKLNPEFGFVACVDLSSDRVRLALVDFTGGLLCQKSIPAVHLNGEEVLQAAIYEIHLLIQSNSLDLKHLLIVSIATPGILDKATQKLHLVPQFEGWEDFPIVELTEQAFSCTILIKNDINTATLGEIHYGAGIGYQSLVYISVDTGVGAGIVLKGQLLEGVHGAAGEIGHMVHDPSSIRPRKRGLGNLEAAISVPMILREATQWMRFASDDYLSQLQELSVQIENGNPGAETIMRKVALTVGYTIVNLHAVLDLETVIIGGAITTFGDLFLRIIRETVDALVPSPLNIVYSGLEHQSVIKGAFVVAQDRVIENLVNEG